MSIVSDIETIGCLNGVAAFMKRFDFLFGVMLVEMLLKHSDNLSKTLQKETLSAAEGQECSSHTKNISHLDDKKCLSTFKRKVIQQVKILVWNIPVFVGDEKLQNDLRLVNIAPAKFNETPEDFLEFNT